MPGVQEVSTVLNFLYSLMRPIIIYYKGTVKVYLKFVDEAFDYDDDDHRYAI